MKKEVATDTGQSVMTKIKSGQVRMRPRLFYVLVSFITGAIILLSSLLVSYLMTIVFFWVRIQTANTMAFGARVKLSEAVSSFPWWALILAGLLFALAVFLIRRQGQMYKHRLSTIVAILLAISLVLGMFLSILGIGGAHSPNRNNEINQGRGWRSVREIIL